MPGPACHRYRVGASCCLAVFKSARALPEQVSGRGDPGHGDRAVLWHRRVGPALSAARAVGFVGAVLAALGQVIRAIGGVPRGSQRRAFAHQRWATPQEVTGGAPLSGIPIGRWAQATAEQRRHRVGLDFVGFRFTAVEGFHRQGMTQDNGQAFVSPEVSEPGPR
jgi:hypothetical protein